MTTLALQSEAPWGSGGSTPRAALASLAMVLFASAAVVNSGVGLARAVLLPAHVATQVRAAVAGEEGHWLAGWLAQQGWRTGHAASPTNRQRSLVGVWPSGLGPTMEPTLVAAEGTHPRLQMLAGAADGNTDLRCGPANSHQWCDHSALDRSRTLKHLKTRALSP